MEKKYPIDNNNINYFILIKGGNSRIDFNRMYTYVMWHES